MIKYLVCLIILPLFSCAQPTQYTLTGTLEVNSGETFPYRIVFTENAGIIKGYSYTYKAPDDTKTAITGTLDRRTHTLTFKETDIVYSHDFHTKAFMCLIEATLEHTIGAGGKVLSGPVNNTEADKTSCTGGRIIFGNLAELKQLFEGTEKFDTVISMKRKAVLPAAAIEKTPKIVAPVVTDKITANIEKTYDWHSDSVIIDIWDGGSQDGDKISLLYNGAAQLQHYLLIKEKKRLRIPLSRAGTDVISVLAENEGLDPPNTASLMLYDGDIPYSVLAYNTKGQQAIIRIRKVK